MCHNVQNTFEGKKKKKKYVKIYPKLNQLEVLTAQILPQNNV